MQIREKVLDVQKRMGQEGIDGWLIYDFQRINPFAWEFLEFSENAHLTRRYFYWIPALGEPVKIVHAIEAHVLDHLPGEKRTYFTWQSMEQELFQLLHGKNKVAMEYSPRNAVPYVSKMDAGIVELVKEKSQVVSSSSFLQYYSCVLNDFQVASHLFAADVLDKTVHGAWQWISEGLKRGKKICEYDVQQWILAEFAKNNCVTDGLPNCSVGPNSANPHYSPPSQGSTVIQQGDFILIDLWCKQKDSGAVFADITRVGVADASASPKQQAVFEIVKRARDEATAFVMKQFEEKIPVRGFEVDEICRAVIEKAGFGPCFMHRTGHNIYTHLHGPGAHLDSLETKDERLLVPGTCFSIEPGIYLKDEFGVRLEYDVYVSKEGIPRITGGIQNEIISLL